LKELKLNESEIRVILEVIESSRNYLQAALEYRDYSILEREINVDALNLCESIIKKLKGEDR
jgi:hypothetical protein